MMTERRAMPLLFCGLAVLNVVLMLRAVPPYDMLFAAHQRVGLGYSSLMVLAALGASLLQAFALRFVLRATGAFAPAQAPSSPPAPAKGPDDGIHWLPHHDIHAKVLHLDTKAGTRDVHPRADAPQLNRGWFVEVEGALAGVYASAQGPVFFLDRQSVLLNRGARASVATGRRRSTFILRADREQIALSYQPPADLHTGDMDAGAFHKDFFHWLAESLPEDSFHTYFTLPKPD